MSPEGWLPRNRDHLYA